MKFTLSWLKEYLDTDASVQEISEKLTMLGLEVDGVEDKAKDFAAFKVAYVKSAEQHPNADRLRVCQVETADHGTVQVVCGAPNARTGMKAVFAPSGSYIPGLDVTLKPSKIRDVESNGMLVSEKEMCLSDEHNGIIDLPEDTKIGTALADVFGLSDVVFEISLTPDRADCAGIYGIARDLAAAGLGTLKPLDVSEVKGGFESPIKTRLDFGGDNTPCPLFLGRYVRGVKNGESPKWLKDKLEALGLRPISALVDITNYTSYAYCRPLHVFDADKLKGNLRVHLADGGEKLIALNHKEYELQKDMTVISDDTGVLEISAIMGGEATGCSKETQNALIICAYFDPIRTSLTGRRLGITSDARYRFERGIDPAFTVPAMEIATKMVMDLCGGDPSHVDVVGSIPDNTKTISFNPMLTKKLTGLDVNEDEQIGILNKLGFTGTKKGGAYEVKTPTWRHDVEGAADLVEEVARVYGFDKIETLTLPNDKVVKEPVETYHGWLTRKARYTLAARGFQECITWAFVNKKTAAIFGSNDNQEEGLELLNPISEDMAQMRPSILPNLLQAAQKNADRGYPNAALFEVSSIFYGTEVEQQPVCAAGVRAQNFAKKTWNSDARNVDIFDAKADAFAVLESIGLNPENAQIARENLPSWYHPERSGALRLGKMLLGYFGEIHPMVLDQMDVDGPVAAFELFLDNAPQKKYKGAAKALLQVNPLMPLSRDFAFIVDESVEASTILASALNADKKMIIDANIFDVYQGKGIEQGKKSIAFSITIQPQDKTLTDQEIEEVSKKVIDSVSAKTGGALRG